MHSPPNPRGPSTAQPSASSNSNPISHTECRPVRAPAQGRQSEEQADPPPQKTKENKQTAQTKEGGGARDRHTAAKPHTHSERGGQTPHAGNTEGDTNGAARKNTWGPPCLPRRNPAESSGPAEERTPRTGRHTPHWGSGGQKKKYGRSPKERGRGDGDQETQDRDRQQRTPPSHDTTGPKTTPPPQPKKKKRGGEGGGQTPPTAAPAHPHATGNPTRRWQETDAAHARGHTPQHPSQKKAECRQSPNPQTQTTNPNQERRSATKTRVQTHTP